MQTFRKLTESLARTTTRRNLFGRGAGIATGALLGVAAGTLTRSDIASATHVRNTVCAFPGLPCPCAACAPSGVCAKPCALTTAFGWASGCWVTAGKTCCDCQCDGRAGPSPEQPGGLPVEVCGCGSDYHNDLHNCPNPAGAKTG